MMIKPLLISALEVALNRYIHLDEDSSLFLAPLAGKTIAVTLTPFNVTVYLCPTAHTIQILENYLGTVDTTISGSPSALGLMGLSASPARAFFSGQVSISGDVHVGHKLQRLFEQLDIDLEEQLAHYTGDIVAHKVGHFLRKAHAWHLDSLHTLQLNISEFLQDESQDLPPEPEIAIFSQQVDQLQEDYERLAARLQRLDLAQQA